MSALTNRRPRSQPKRRPRLGPSHRPRLQPGHRPRLGRRLAPLVVAALTLLGTGAAWAIAPAASAQANLLANGDFAAGSTAGWTCSPGDTVVTSPVYDGASYALAGTPTSGDDAQCSQVVSVQPDSSYALTGWVEGDYVYLGDSGTGGTDTDDWTRPVPRSPAWPPRPRTRSPSSPTTRLASRLRPAR